MYPEDDSHDDEQKLLGFHLKNWWFEVFSAIVLSYKGRWEGKMYKTMALLAKLQYFLASPTTTHKQKTTMKVFEQMTPEDFPTWAGIISNICQGICSNPQQNDQGIWNLNCSQ